MPPSLYVNRYPPQPLIDWLVSQPYLHTAPDIPRGHPALDLIRAYHAGRSIAYTPCLAKPGAPDRLLWAGSFAMHLVKAFNLNAEVLVGEGETATYWQAGKPTVIVLGRHDTVAVLHEVAHALFGPSEAVAAAWPLRQLR
jgi:hypothetical protein